MNITESQRLPDKRQRNDSWDEPYFYENKNDGQSFRLVSKGEDRQQGTEDDITFVQQNDP
jgi:hypothetical protein